MLVNEYIARMPDDIARKRSQVLDAELDKVHFAWIGATRAEDAPKPTASFGCEAGDTRWECIPLGFPYYYRVQAPTFLIEDMRPTAITATRSGVTSRTATSAKTSCARTTPMCRTTACPRERCSRLV